MDDTLLLARVKMLNESNDKVKGMIVRHSRGLDWLAAHQCKFMVNKCAGKSSLTMPFGEV